MLRDTTAVNPRRVRISGPPHQHQTARGGLCLLRLFPAAIRCFVVWIVPDGFLFPQHLEGCQALIPLAWQDGDIVSSGFGVPFGQG
jgi:hypothetical protein